MDYSFKENIIKRIPRFLQSNILLSCVVLLLVLKIAVTLVPINFPQNIFFADITKITLENFANQTRQSMGLQALTENQKLAEAARMKAENMVQNQYFSHTSPTGVTPWFWFLQAGYHYKYAGENLAIGFFDSKEVYDAWLNSASHKANIVNPNYTEVGTAVLGGFGQNNTIVVVQEFGSPLPVKTAATKPQVKPVTVTPAPAPAPVPTPAPASVAPNTNEEVLSQSTEFKSSIAPTTGNGTNNLYSKILNSVLYDYDNLLQEIVYGVSLVVIGILLTLIFFNLNTNFKKELVFRAVLIMVLLSAATLINREIIVALIPHQILI